MEQINIVSLNRETQLFNKTDNYQFVLCDNTGYRYQTHAGYDDLQNVLQAKSKHKMFVPARTIEFTRSQSLVNRGSSHVPERFSRGLGAV